MSCRIPRRYVWLKRFAVAFGLLLTVVIALPVLANWYAVPRLGALMAEQERRQDALRMAAAEDPPKSAIYLLQACQALRLDEPYEGALDDVIYFDALPMLAPELVGEVLDANRDALARFEQFIATAPQKWEHLPVPLEDISYSSVRRLAQLITLDAEFALRAGDWAHAIERQQQLLTIAEHIGQQQTMVTSLSSLSYRGGSYNQQLAIASLVLSRPGVLQENDLALECLIEAYLEPVMLAPVTTPAELLYEYDHNLPEVLQDVIPGKSSPYIDIGSRLAHLSLYRDWAKHPVFTPIGALNTCVPHYAAEVLADSEDKTPACTLALIGQSLGWWHEWVSAGMRRALKRSESRRYFSAIALACVRFRDQHGRWPVELTELVPAYLPYVPTDPQDPNRAVAYALTPESPLIGTAAHGLHGVSHFPETPLIGTAYGLRGEVSYFAVEESGEALLRWNNYLATRHGPPREEEWQDPNAVR